MFSLQRAKPGAIETSSMPTHQWLFLTTHSLFLTSGQQACPATELPSPLLAKHLEALEAHLPDFCLSGGSFLTLYTIIIARESIYPDSCLGIARAYYRPQYVLRG